MLSLGPVSSDDVHCAATNVGNKYLSFYSEPERKR